ncbi:hypothetical protein ACOJUR_09350 [Alicyclobacillus tolerans]|uniref:Uncharacterized protein n=2 Tax=Alicyclobacillus tolerans TaxID=90970 RepID=A0ABT9LVA9_9BACL|nr:MULTISPECIES: hypothetical protein [Alicyclobacillus]MDP9728179.1 hypothetical protein [Alicyclobacillus tengchongensis]SHJ83791.1 hypothetical protein SAMN05443507_10490 [Alicyclobacillus montanus]
MSIFRWLEAFCGLCVALLGVLKAFMEYRKTAAELRKTDENEAADQAKPRS